MPILAPYSFITLTGFRHAKQKVKGRNILGYKNNNYVVFQGVKSLEKYQSGNFISKYLVKKFMNSIIDLVRQTNVHNVNEIGCGEGQLIGALASLGYSANGYDICQDSLDTAIRETERFGLNITYKLKSVYDLDVNSDTSELVLCCEVLEHLDDPQKALSIIEKLSNPYFIVSVPREPIWSLLNMIRGKYLKSFGNTPGHIQRWSKKSFIDLVSKYATIIEIRSPLPWTILLCKTHK